MQTTEELKETAEERPDDLLESLLLLCDLYEVSTTRDALTSGLPLQGGRLTPDLLCRAAARARLTCRINKFELSQIPAEFLPAMLLLKDEGACLLLGWDAERKNARVILPAIGEAEILLSREDLASRYYGHVAVFKPKFRFDQRAPVVGDVRLQHWFWGVLSENSRVYRDIMLAAFLVNMFALAMPLFTMNVYDRIVPNKSVETLWMMGIGVALIIIGDFILRTVRGYFLDWASQRVDIKLSSRIMERVLGVRLENRPLSVGSFASNLRSFETVRDFITSATITTFIDIPFAFIFIAVMAWIAWPMIIPVVFGGIIMLIYSLSVQTKMHELSETMYRATAMRNATLIESLVGLDTVKAMGIEGIMQTRWERSTAFLAEVGGKLRLLSSTINNGSMGLQQFITVAMLLLGVYLVMHGDLTMGGLIASTMLASRALSPISQAAGLMTQYHNASTALTSLESIMNNPVERPDDASFLSRSRFRGDVEFREVTFNYPESELSALTNVSFKIRAGEHVAILGRMGSGKTTLHKLILGLYQPTSGAVLVDGIDIRQLDPAELRRNIGYVQQDTNLFFGTMKDNIAISALHADDAAIIQAARVGGIDEFINLHPKGYDMAVGERGETLSGGQKQGVGIARAVINHPPILLLDEPTSAMDHSGEEVVKQRLKQEAAGKTMMLISHRSSLFDLVDRIIVIDGGRIMADGPKKDIVEALKAGKIAKAL
ncbi:MAG: type I secretion system permease/ATPase [Betaproteobacteria bacterium HGW-Betaproteobacteria-8]|nr:MAG: type I secretion system permease/ATPase [Betaproteobacteria bacterium HGW-Betaproteobacteria-8]